MKHQDGLPRPLFVPATPSTDGEYQYGDGYAIRISDSKDGKKQFVPGVYATRARVLQYDTFGFFKSYDAAEEELAKHFNKRATAGAVN
jgi:hypothetical protein